MKKQKKWNVKYRSGDSEVEAAVRSIAAETGLSEITARLLYIRGYHTPESASRFLRMEETTFHDPFLLGGMQDATDRIFSAIERQEKIAIYGDYDVDGVTSVSLLYLYLKEYAADVIYYIPSRSMEGYGLSVQAIEKLKDMGVHLIVTVDTGITANAETRHAKSLGIDVVVTDHHECRADLPEACAVVNPHVPEDPYPFRELAGVGVVFKLVCAMEMQKCRKNGTAEIDGVRRICQTYADLVALGTVADVMPALDENRLIVAMGIRLMETNCRLGLQALIDAANAAKEKGKPKRKITSTYIGYVLAPRMNAAGRVSSATIAVELLLSTTKEQADMLAERLCQLNVERQIEENRITEAAYKKIEGLSDADKQYVIVLDDDSWHQGIIGIVSSRITEKYGLPSILISYDGAIDGAPSGYDIGKGSGRSIKGLNLVDALTATESLLVRYGGHELAAGLSIRRHDVDAFRKQINAYAAEALNGETLCMTLEADTEIEISELTMRLIEEMDVMEPFGVTNPTPAFVLRDANVLRLSSIGGGKHVRFTVEKNGTTFNAVWFNMPLANLSFEETDQIDVLFQLNVNEFQNRTFLQMSVSDARISERSWAEYEQQMKRYEEIRSGSEYTVEEQILPSRDDVADVYTYLRREFRLGKTSFPIRRLMKCIRSKSGEPFNYIKLKFIIRILQELQICGVVEPVPDHFLFDMFYPTKTNLEKSSILHKLKSQQRH